MKRQFIKYFAFFLFLILLFPQKGLCENEVVKPLFPGLIKGSVKDYFPEIFDNHHLVVVEGFSFNSWAGKLYLMRKTPSKDMGIAVQMFYSSAADKAMEYAKGYCSGFFRRVGIKSGYYFVDHFEVIPVYDEGIASIIITGNVFCFSR